MTMASGLYLPTIRDAMDTTSSGGGIIDMLSSSNKVVLVTDSYTPDFDTHDLYNDVTNELSTAGGYTQDNKTVGGTPTWAYTTAHRLAYNWSAAVTWTSASFTARGLVLKGTTTGNPLVCAVTFGQDYTATNGTFSVTAAAAGLFYITVA